MFNPTTYQWLKDHLAAWHQTVPFDGLWLDMNEPASFCEGMLCEADPTNTTAWHCKYSSSLRLHRMTPTKLALQQQQQQQQLVF